MDLNLLQDLNRTRTPPRAPSNTASNVGGVSQTNTASNVGGVSQTNTASNVGGVSQTNTPSNVGGVSQTNPASNVGGVSQTADVQLFHLDVADCPRSAGTVFRGVRGVVVGPSFNSSTDLPTPTYGYHCHWTIVVPDGLRVAAAIHLGNSSDKFRCNRALCTI